MYKKFKYLDSSGVKLMNRVKKIYFLAAFVMIIGCYTLNKSYSLFVATEEQEIVSAKVLLSKLL